MLDYVTMLNLEEVLEMWKKDSTIDEMMLDDAQLAAVKLHGKYLELLTTAKLSLKRRELEQQVLLRDKWLYFNGKMDKAEMDKRGWPYDPFNGLKILRNDMEYFFNSDPELQKSEERVTYLKTLVSTLEEIMGTLKWRHQQLKNMIEWRKFTSGG